MTLKEEIMQLKTYEEFDANREKYNDEEFSKLWKSDREFREHLFRLYPTGCCMDSEVYKPGQLWRKSFDQ